MAAIKTQTVPALEKALTVLELLAKSKAGLSLPELVQQSGLPRSSIHCLLVTLERRGYLHRNERTSRYMFGLKFLGLANNALSGLKLRDQATPHLQNLMRKTQLTVHMAILEQHEAVLIARCEPPGTAHLATWIGKRMEVHCTALGKALIAYLPEGELDQLLRDRGLPRHNENTIASPRRLKEDLAGVLRNGYALDDEEDELGARCIGVPVFDSDGAVIAAISVAGGTAQVSSVNLATLAQQLQATAAAITQSRRQRAPRALAQGA